MGYFSSIIASGLHNGMLYALLAYGYVLTGIVTKRPNLAHGALFAFSGQVLVLAANAGYSVLWMTLPAAILFGASVSALLCAILLMVLSSRLMPPFLERSPNGMIVVTLAVAIVMMEAARIGADTRDYWLPPLMNARVPLLPTQDPPTVTRLQLLNIAAIFAIIATCEYVLRKTGAGRALRAVADDRFAASLGGIDAARLISRAIAAGGALSAVGGMLALLYFGNMSFGSGLTYALKVLFIASAGGFSAPLPAAVAAFVYGEAEALWDGYLPAAWRDAVFFSALAFVLIMRRENRSSLP